MAPKSKPTYDLEMELRNQGFRYVVGVDEVGRGCGAGNVVAASILIPDGFDTSEIRDSKQLSRKKRKELFLKLVAECECTVHSIGPDVIDSINIRESTKLAMQFAIKEMKNISYVLVDGNFLPDYLEVPGKAVIGGDKLSVSIAASSIIAKHTRDRQMFEAHKQWPQYGFDRHVGYLTKFHKEMISKYGPCPIHRKTFSGVREYVKE